MTRDIACAEAAIALLHAFNVHLNMAITLKILLVYNKSFIEGG